MSRRRVYFTRYQTIWHCAHAIKQETGWYSEFWPADRYDFASSARDHVEDPWTPELDIDRVWNDVVQEFSSCGLTRATDTLPALSGLALQYRDVHTKLRNRTSNAQLRHDVYLAGH